MVLEREREKEREDVFLKMFWYSNNVMIVIYIIVKFIIFKDLLFLKKF